LRYDSIFVKFTGYFRDAETGLDYANQRYHQPGMGRFMSPDPYMASGGPSNPGSWNKYGYVQGDPVNFVDRKGLELECTDDDCDESSYDCQSGYYWDEDVGQCEPEYGAPKPGKPTKPKKKKRNAQKVEADFYKKYQTQLNDCIQSVFGADASKIPTQTLANSAAINTMWTETQLETIAGVTYPVAGFNAPSSGPYGTVYIASDIFYGSTPNTLNAIYGTYVHELGNILNYTLNGSERTYGNPSDPTDTDTGSALEKCVFGSLQNP
jgi:RHS repeat-associated protein